MVERGVTSASETNTSASAICDHDATSSKRSRGTSRAASPYTSVTTTVMSPTASATITTWTNAAHTDSRKKIATVGRTFCASASEHENAKSTATFAARCTSAATGRCPMTSGSAGERSASPASAVSESPHIVHVRSCVRSA
jgi:hypothetical protein